MGDIIFEGAFRILYVADDIAGFRYFNGKEDLKKVCEYIYENREKESRKGKSMILIKVRSSEWCDADVYEVVSKYFTKIEFESKNIKEFKCLRGGMREEIDVNNKELVECLKSYSADDVLILEGEFDYPQVVLIFLKERKIMHFFTLEKMRGLWIKPDWYRQGKHIIRD